MWQLVPVIKTLKVMNIFSAYQVTVILNHDVYDFIIIAFQTIKIKSYAIYIYTYTYTHSQTLLIIASIEVQTEIEYIYQRKPQQPIF